MKLDTAARARIQKITRERVPETGMKIAKILICVSAVCLGMLVLFLCDVLKSKGGFVYATLLAMPILFIAVSVWCLVKKGQGWAFPYLFMGMLLFLWFGLEMMSGYKSKMLLPFAVVLSLQAYDKRLTLYTYGLSVIGLAASNYANAYLYRETGFLDLNLVSFDTTHYYGLQGFLYNNIIDLSPDPAVLLHNGFWLSVVPNFLFLTLITGLVFLFMRQNLLHMLKAELLAEKEANERRELSEMKTKIVLSQVKPHFIYNALSSIAMYCTENPEKAQELTLDFSDYLRNNLDSLEEDGATVCSFSTELSHIQSYLNIEKCRFEEKLTVEYDVPVCHFDVPALSIQPIVENAVKHGVCKKKHGGTVRIATREDEEAYVVTVTDDGVGFDPAAVQNDGKVHVGLSNIRKRLSLYGGTFAIESRVGEGTVATVTIPKRRNFS